MLAGTAVQFNSPSVCTLSFGLVYRLNAVTSAPEIGTTANAIWVNTFTCIPENASSRVVTSSMLFLKPFLFANNGFPTLIRDIVFPDVAFTNITGKLFSQISDDIQTRYLKLCCPTDDRHSNKHDTRLCEFNPESIPDTILSADALGNDGDVDPCIAFTTGGGHGKYYAVGPMVNDLSDQGFEFPSVAESLNIACLHQYFADALAKIPVRKPKTSPPYYVTTEDELELGVELFRRYDVHTVFDAFAIKCVPHICYIANIECAFPKHFVSPASSAGTQNYSSMAYFKFWNNFVAYATVHHRQDLIQCYFDIIVCYFTESVVWMPQHFSDCFWSTKPADQKAIGQCSIFRYPAREKSRICILTLEDHASAFSDIYTTFERDNPNIDLRAQPLHSDRELTRVQQSLLNIQYDGFSSHSLPEPGVNANPWQECIPGLRAPLNDSPHMRFGYRSRAHRIRSRAGETQEFDEIEVDDDYL